MVLSEDVQYVDLAHEAVDLAVVRLPALIRIVHAPQGGHQGGNGQAEGYHGERALRNLDVLFGHVRVVTRVYRAILGTLTAHLQHAFLR